MSDVPVVIPDLGEIVASISVVEWHKKVGDQVAFDEDLLEIVTEKMEVMIQSPASGVLSAIHAHVGDHVRVGHVVGVITPR